MCIRLDNQLVCIDRLQDKRSVWRLNLFADNLEWFNYQWMWSLKILRILAFGFSCRLLVVVAVELVWRLKLQVALADSNCWWAQSWPLTFPTVYFNSVHCLNLVVLRWDGVSICWWIGRSYAVLVGDGCWFGYQLALHEFRCAELSCWYLLPCWCWLF